MNTNIPLIIVIFCVLSLITGAPKEDEETKEDEDLKEDKETKHDKSGEIEKENKVDKDDDDEKDEESEDDRSKDDESIDDESEDSEHKDQEETKNYDHSKIDVIARFALELFRKVAEEERHHSFSLSALPIWKQLSCLLPGAEGDTKKQLRKLLYHGEKEEDVKNELFSPRLNEVLKVYSRIYITEDAKLKPEYLHKKRHRRSIDDEEQDGSGVDDHNSKCDYSTLFKQVDFSNVKEANKTINHDFNKASHHKFGKVLSKGIIDKKTKMLMINAVEFKGKLLESFDEKHTVKKNFYNYKNEKVGHVNMMIKKSIFPYYYSTELGASILELPYENKMSLFVYLPDATDIDSMDMLNKFKDPKKVMKKHGKMNDTKVEVHIPKFKATGNIYHHLKKALEHMGMEDIFKPEDAKLQGFLEDEVDDFSLNIVSQAFRFTVNENGSKEGDKVHGSSIKFICNRPFAFMVIDKETGHPIITGEFNSPKDIHL